METARQQLTAAGVTLGQEAQEPQGHDGQLTKRRLRDLLSSHEATEAAEYLRERLQRWNGVTTICRFGLCVGCFGIIGIIYAKSIIKHNYQLVA